MTFQHVTTVAVSVNTKTRVQVQIDLCRHEINQARTRGVCFKRQESTTISPPTYDKVSVHISYAIAVHGFKTKDCYVTEAYFLSLTISPVRVECRADFKPHRCEKAAYQAEIGLRS